MSPEQLKAFLAKVKSDTSLQQKLRAAGNAEAAVAIAEEAGFLISSDDLKDAQSADLSDEELEGAAGGGDCVLGRALSCLLLGSYAKQNG